MSLDFGDETKRMSNTQIAARQRDTTMPLAATKDLKSSKTTVLTSGRYKQWCCGREVTKRESKF